MYLLCNVCCSLLPVNLWTLDFYRPVLFPPKFSFLSSVFRSLRLGKPVYILFCSRRSYQSCAEDLFVRKSAQGHVTNATKIHRKTSWFSRNPCGRLVQAVPKLQFTNQIFSHEDTMRELLGGICKKSICPILYRCHHNTWKQLLINAR